MKQINLEGAQNVEVSKKIACKKPLLEQLAIMERYTSAHKTNTGQSNAAREYACLEVLFSQMFAPIEMNDRFVGRLDFLPIGFGSVTSIGGAGHYCVFSELRNFGEKLTQQIDKDRVDVLYRYWQEHDVKTLYREEMMDDYTGHFIDCDYPLLATARLSGMMLHYDVLCELGINGLKDKVNVALIDEPANEYLRYSFACLDLFGEVINKLLVDIQVEIDKSTDTRKQQLQIISQSLNRISQDKPEHFHQAIQLIWLYALMAGCINYGRMDDILGPYLVQDIESGYLSWPEAEEYLVSLWTLIENRRTTVNGRIIVGGYGRKNVRAADEFTKLAIKVTKRCKYVEPQFTLRFNKETSAEIMDMAYDCLGAGVTYPTLYNDDVNVEAVKYGLRVDEQTAQQYVPFGCGEFVIQGQSVGTPNTLLNLLKILNITLNNGIDPLDGVYRAGNVDLKPINELLTFEDFYQQYLRVLDFYFDLSVEKQYRSYEIMNNEVSFLFTSILMDDCITRGKALLDGGVRYLGGTNETYGNINTSDSLTAIKTLVFDQKVISLTELNEALLHNFVGYEQLQNRCLACGKYGNDIKEVDDLATALFTYVAKGISQRGIDYGMQYYLIVISNNQTNTDWGRATGASADGRKNGMFMNPANNPQGGANVSGPTALLNSLAKFPAKYHGGSVQNIKFTPRMFNESRNAIKYLFTTYFNAGGSQLMVTIVDKGVLEDAQKYPENYPDLIVRVSGFSAVFVDLQRDVQDELLSRVLYD